MAAVGDIQTAGDGEPPRKRIRLQKSRRVVTERLACVIEEVSAVQSIRCVIRIKTIFLKLIHCYIFMYQTLAGFNQTLRKRPGRS